jgi:transposase InsO family protein
LLLPTLQPGDIVVTDNLGSHKGPAIRRAIRTAGARLVFLPPYSPDLNPIEQAFAKLKSCSAKPKNAPSKASGVKLADFSNTSHLKNAQTTCATPDMLRLKSERL